MSKSANQFYKIGPDILSRQEEKNKYFRRMNTNVLAPGPNESENLSFELW